MVIDDTINIYIMVMNGEAWWIMVNNGKGGKWWLIMMKLCFNGDDGDDGD